MWEEALALFAFYDPQSRDAAHTEVTSLVMHNLFNIKQQYYSICLHFKLKKIYNLIGRF